MVCQSQLALCWWRCCVSARMALTHPVLLRINLEALGNIFKAAGTPHPLLVTRVWSPEWQSHTQCPFHTWAVWRAQCSLPFATSSPLLWCEGSPKTCAFCAGMPCWNLSRCWRHPAFAWSCSCCHTVKWEAKWSPWSAEPISRGWAVSAQHKFSVFPQSQGWKWSWSR